MTDADTVTIVGGLVGVAGTLILCCVAAYTLVVCSARTPAALVSPPRSSVSTCSSA